MATVSFEIYEIIRGKCVSDAAASAAAKDVAIYMEAKFTSYNSESAPLECHNQGCSHRSVGNMCLSKSYFCERR